MSTEHRPRGHAGAPDPAETLRAWREQPIAPEPAPAASARRRDVVARMSMALREAGVERQRRATWQRQLGGLAAAAAMALLLGAAAWRGLGAARAPEARLPAAVIAPADKVVAGSGDVVLVHGERRMLAPVGTELALEPGDEVTTALGGNAVLELEVGARVAASPSTTVRLLSTAQSEASAGERIGLSAGVVTIRVPKLAEGRTFGVRTPDADVIVRGTAFEVAVYPGPQGGTVTAVNVSEGVVVVRHVGGESEVAAGRRWLSTEPGVVTSAADAVTPNAAAPPVTIAGDGTSPGSTAAPGLTVSPTTHKSEARHELPASQLAEQNRLFQAAMAHRRRGDDRQAIAALDELLAKHPRSPLTQEARMERTAALARLAAQGQTSPSTQTETPP